MRELYGNHNHLPQHHNLMKRLIPVFLVLSLRAGAQAPARPVFNNQVFLEVLGNGGYGSLNYEHVVSRKGRWSAGISAGVSTFKTKDFAGRFNPDLIIPFSLRCYYGGSRHKLLLGAGQTLTSVSKLNTEDFSPQRHYALSACLMAGYRFDMRRLALQLAFTPILENYHHYRNWLGLAVGYKF